jgi:hypothetical protein
MEIATTPDHTVNTLFLKGTLTETIDGVPEPSTLALMIAPPLVPLIQRVTKRRRSLPGEGAVMVRTAR